MKMYRNSSNLLDPAIIANGYTLNYNTGLPVADPTRIATLSPISVEGISSITVTYTTEISELYFICALFNNEILVERIAQKYSGYSISVNNGNKIYLSFYKTGVTVTTNDVSNIMINVGRTALPYEPYNVKDWYGYTYNLRASGAWTAGAEKKRSGGAWT